jgi:hypothetical protein
MSLVAPEMLQHLYGAIENHGYHSNETPLRVVLMPTSQADPKRGTLVLHMKTSPDRERKRQGISIMFVAERNFLNKHGYSTN